MRPYMIFLTAVLIGACATTAKSPEIVDITFLSMERSKITSYMVMGEYHSESFEETGYKIRFKSNRQIIMDLIPSGNSFLSLDIYECNSPARYEVNHEYSAREYISFSRLTGKVIERQVEGPVIYEAEISEGTLRTAKQPICAQIFVNGNTNRKVWRPAIISNKIELQVPK